jgi:hypothetical protein
MGLASHFKASHFEKGSLLLSNKVDATITVILTIVQQCAAKPSICNGWTLKLAGQ